MKFIELTVVDDECKPLEKRLFNISLIAVVKPQSHVCEGFSKPCYVRLSTTHESCFVQESYEDIKKMLYVGF